MELAPRIHEGHREGRTVPGSRADGAHSLGGRLGRNCVSFKTVLFPPVEERKDVSEPINNCSCKNVLSTILCYV